MNMKTIVLRVWRRVVWQKDILNESATPILRIEDSDTGSLFLRNVDKLVRAYMTSHH
jgi:hypothetical protein